MRVSLGFSLSLVSTPTITSLLSASVQTCRLFLTICIVARQSPLSMGFSRQEYWSGWPFSPRRDLTDPGIRPASPAPQADTLPLSHQRSLGSLLLYFIAIPLHSGKNKSSMPTFSSLYIRFVNKGNKWSSGMAG